MFLYLLGLASGQKSYRVPWLFFFIGLLLFNLGKEVVKILVFPSVFAVYDPGAYSIAKRSCFPLQLFAAKISFFIHFLSPFIRKEHAWFCPCSVGSS